jgi:hypothetical protein
MPGGHFCSLPRPSRSPSITYITEKQPNDIQWLTFDDAGRLGIEARKFPPG